MEQHGCLKEYGQSGEFESSDVGFHLEEIPSPARAGVVKVDDLQLTVEVDRYAPLLTLTNPVALVPPNGRCASPPTVGLLTCTSPTSLRSTKRMVCDTARV